MTNRINLMDYIIGDGSVDDSAGFQTAINAATASLGLLDTPGFELYCEPGHHIRLDSGIVIAKPLIAKILSVIDYRGTTGTALTIGAAGNQQYHDLHFVGFVNSTGNTTWPSGINSSGTTGVEVLNLNFSKVRIDTIQGFTRYGFYGNGTNDHFTGQNIQYNTFDLGQTVNNGVNLNFVSNSAVSGSFEANFVHVQNSYQGIFNMYCDGAATSSNYFLFDAMDDISGTGGQGMVMNGCWNRIDMTYAGCNSWFGSTSAHNTLNVYNTSATGATYTSGGTNNHYNIAT